MENHELSGEATILGDTSTRSRVTESAVEYAIVWDRTFLKIRVRRHESPKSPKLTNPDGFLFEEAYNYCTTNWCITEAGDSFVQFIFGCLLWA